MGLNPRHLSGLFARAVGQTFTDYRAGVRVGRARTLLGYRHLRVSQIAFQVGFRSLSQFNRTFRRLTGGSPQAFRTLPTPTELGEPTAAGRERVSPPPLRNGGCPPADAQPFGPSA